MLAEALADEVASNLRDAIAARGEAWLVVSGGSTPKPFFTALRKADLPWSLVTVSVADERWVPIDHDESTEKLVRECLQPDRMFSMTPLENESVAEGAARIDATLRASKQSPDVVILGMGPDGHTASLFPDHPSHAGVDMSGSHFCIAVTNSPKPPAERVSLTAPLLCRAQHLYLHMTGEDKREVLEREDATLPITQVLNTSATSPHIYWAA